MKILWLVNIALPEAAQLMDILVAPFGGWLVNASFKLASISGVNLYIAFPKSGLSDVLQLQGERINYYSFPPVHEKDIASNRINPHLIKILEKANPDIVHIFGTEYPHTLAMVNTCDVNKVIISIQGLTSIYAKHYMASLAENIQNRNTFRDLVKRDNLKQQQVKFAKRGLLEIEALKKVRHIIGRTTWDRACTYQINPDAIYHHCNETLRDEFYKHEWDIQKCEKHSIFVSQGSYPIKGLHYMLEAMPLILKNFPDAQLYVGGTNITKSDTFKDRLKLSSYGKYIKDLIKRYNLENNVIFTGLLDEKQMCKRYLRSHVFVCPSSIENSPNSLGEAMILGVPCVASDVGGVSDMIQHREEGYIYQADAPYMLAYYVGEIFKNDEIALQISEKARKHALITHDPNKNLSRLLEIYKEINSSSL